MKARERFDDPNKKIYSLCVTKKIGLIDENNKIVKDEIKFGIAHFLKNDADIEAALAKCAVQKDTPEETGYALWKCMLKIAKTI